MDKSSIKLSMKIPGYSHLVKPTIFYTVVVAGVLYMSVGEESWQLAEENRGKSDCGSFHNTMSSAYIVLYNLIVM